MKKTVFLTWIVITLMLASPALTARGQRAPAGQSGSGDSAYTVTDLAGRVVRLSGIPKRALAIAGPSYEKVFLLGQASRLAGAHFFMVNRPWVVATNPNIANVTPIRSPGEPNIEALYALDPDVAFFWDYEDSLKSLTDAGIPTVVVQNSSGNPRTANEFINYQKREVMVFANTFGADAIKKADEWCAYFDEKVAYVRGKTAGIPDAARKTALYAYGEDGLGVFSQYSYVSFWLELAGGKNLADETRQEMDTVVTAEQIFAWDPDFYFMGRMESTDALTADSRWARLSAVRNGHVYLCPDGVMYWDYSSEGVLLMQYLAQKMYPELFTELDMIAETQAYYRRFYDYNLSAENARRLLAHLPPN